MCLVASSSPPFSPPPPCGDEKEEDSAEEEESDGGGGGAPRDLGWAGAGRGGPETAPLEPRVLGNSPQRTRSADLCSCALLRAWAQARPLALAPTFLSSPHPSTATATRRREKGTSPTPFGGWRSPPGPPQGTGRGPRAEEEISRGFPFSSPVSPKELKMAENVVEPGPPSAKRPKLSSPALSASASDGTG